MSDMRLLWEPENKTPFSFIEKKMSYYLENKKGGVTILSNGTLIFSPSGRDDYLDAQKAMQEAKYLIDFDVRKMKDGVFLIKFHDAIAGFVSEEEYAGMADEIKRRINELKFPGEMLMGEGDNQSSVDLLIGLYARGKLQYDAYHFSFYKRICK